MSYLNNEGDKERGKLGRLVVIGMVAVVIALVLGFGVQDDIWQAAKSLADRVM